MTVLLLILAVAFLIFIAFSALRYINDGQDAADERNAAGVIWNIAWLVIAALAADSTFEAISALTDKL